MKVLKELLFKENLSLEEKYFEHTPILLFISLSLYMKDELMKFLGTENFNRLDVSSRSLFSNFYKDFGVDIERKKMEYKNFMIKKLGLEMEMKFIDERHEFTMKYENNIKEGRKNDLIRYSNPEKIRSQGQRGTCTAFACLNIYEIERARRGLKYIDLSRQFLYYNTKMQEVNPTQDGATLYATLNALREYGVCPEELCEYQEILPEDDPDFPQGKKPSEEAFEGALNYRITIFRREAESVERFKSIIDEGNAILCGVPVFESWANEYTYRYGEIPDPLGEYDRLLGYHGIAIIGYDDEKRRFILKNSWTKRLTSGSYEGWATESVTGYPGYGTISYFYIENFVHTPYTIVDFIESEKEKGFKRIISAFLSSTFKENKITFFIIFLIIGLILFLIGFFGRDEIEKKVDDIRTINFVKELEGVGKKDTYGVKKEKSGNKKRSVSRKKKSIEKKKSMDNENIYKRIVTYTKGKKEKPLFYFVDKEFFYLQIYPRNSIVQLEKALFLEKGELYKYNDKQLLDRLRAYSWIKVPVERLKPFVIFEVKKGDTLRKIAERFGGDIYSLRVLNHIWRNKDLKPGYKIIILQRRKK